MSNAETEYMGGRKARLWSYMILMLVLVLGAVIVNVVIKDPALAREGVNRFLGMPRWAFPIIMGVVGILIFWVGLKIETDWPEALGAFLISGAIAAGEFMFGWNRFAFGGLMVIPYVIPLLIFFILLMVGMVKSR